MENKIAPEDLIWECKKLGELTMPHLLNILQTQKQISEEYVSGIKEIILKRLRTGNL